MKKTEEIRMRGFRTSVLGFMAAILFILGAIRMNEDVTSFFPTIIMIGCFLAATAAFVYTLRKRAERLKKQRDGEYGEREGNK